MEPMFQSVTEPEDTVAYLVPQNEAGEVVLQRNPDKAHHDKKIAPSSVWRIEASRCSKNFPHLTKFGGCSTSDVVLHSMSTDSQQCYIDFDTATKSLIIRDVSKNKDTQVHEFLNLVFGDIPFSAQGPPLMTDEVRECKIPLMTGDDESFASLYIRRRAWLLKLGDINFHLVPALDAERAISACSKVFETSDHHLSEVEEYLVRFPSLRCLDIFAQQDKGPIGPWTQIGSGSAGDVHEVVVGRQRVACKLFKDRANPSMVTSKEGASLRDKQQVNLIKRLQRKNLMEVFGLQYVGAGFRMFMPLCSGNLRQLIQRGHEQRQEAQLPDVVMTMLEQISDALNFLRTRNPALIHDNVKPTNILVRGDQFVLADFGISSMFAFGLTIFKDLEFRVAPESWSARSSKVDIWALGVVIVDCLGGQEKYGLRQAMNKVIEEKEVEWRFTFPDCERHMRSMLQEDPDKRPTVQEVCSDLQSRNFVRWRGWEESAQVKAGSPDSSPVNDLGQHDLVSRPF